MSPARLSRQASPPPSAHRGIWRWLIPMVAIVLVLGAGVTFWPPSEDTAPDEIPASPPHYPISGYFITANADASANREKLEEIQAVGGDTVITFGTLLRPSSQEDLPADCTIDGISCAKVVVGALQVNRYFTYSDGADWDKTTLLCPRDRNVSANGKSYTILVLPTEGKGCTSPAGSYDVVVVGGNDSSAEDPAIALAKAATELHMDFFAGLPAPVKRTDVEYLPDLSYAQTLNLFTERFLRYQAEKNDVSGLAGFYHHVEMPISSSAFFDPILSLYQMQNEAIHRLLPTRSAIISPYIESRRSASSVSPDVAGPAMRKIAQTSSGLKLNIAIQDGMGTGKGAAYPDSESGSAVDEFAATIVGNGTWGQKYMAPNVDYFRSAAAGVSGTGAVLWANMEGMAPATEKNTCSSSLRGQTTLERMDRQLQQLGASTKVISFMWDPYFTCKGTGTPLKTQMASGFKAPIVTESTLNQEGRVLNITGFNISGGEATVSWKLNDGRIEKFTSKTSIADARSSGPGSRNPELETLTFSLDDTSIDSGTPYTINVTNQWGVGLNKDFADGVFAP
jgi:hypothetical protein